MARRPKDLLENRVASCILAAMRRLHAAGHVLMGPKAIGDEAAAEYGKPIASTLASHYLRRLAEHGEVARQSQGPRRGLYRLRKKSAKTETEG